MVNYKNGKIYKIVNDNTDDIYVGSTTIQLSHRFQAHKNKAEKVPTRKLYKFINDNDGFDNFRIILIENFACNNREELLQREQYYKDLLKPSLNTYNCYGTDEDKRAEYIKQHNKDYYEKNNDKEKKRHKEYYEKNNDKLLQQKKEYYQKNKDGKTQYNKEYYQKNKDKVKQLRKEYYEKNKNKKVKYNPADYPVMENIIKEENDELKAN